MKLEQRIPILIPCRNNVEYTKKAVASLLKNTNPKLFECLLIDNGSTDDTPAYLKQLVERDPEHFRVITIEKNLGFGGGLNRGLDLLSSFKWEYGVIANNDLLFTPNWLEQMMECMALVPDSEQVGIVGPVSNFAGGCQGVPGEYRTVADLDKFSEVFHGAHKGQYVETGVVVGLLMLFRRKFVDEVGFFDERFFPGTWEENDLELRGAIKGWKYVVDMSTFIHHYGSKTLAVEEASKDQRKNFLTNRNRFREKWCGVESPWEDVSRDNYVKRGMDPKEHLMEDGRQHKWVVAACRVKDGARYLDRTLTRVSEFADEIVILVDQKTTDNTEEICKKFPKVISLEKETPHDYNEAWSRNYVLQMAFERHPDWVYCFDADEVIEKRAIEHREELTDPVDPAICMWVQPIVQLWNGDNTRRIDGLWGNFYQGRMFRMMPGQDIKNSNSLIHCGSTPFIPRDRHGFSYIKIIHYGNVDSTVRAGKHEWYTKTDTDKDLNMILGAHKDYYWQLYYGAPRPDELQGFNNQWKILPDDKEWSRPPFGCFYDRDAYRHVQDEKGLVLVPYDEEETVSLCMLNHNEGAFLSRAICSARPYINELIVVDTGSTDGSDSMAEQFGAKVYSFDWVNDFSAARNFSLSKSTCKWILRIDPDEAIPQETGMRIPSLIKDQKVDGFVFPIKNWLQDPSTPNAQWALSETCRLYRNRYPVVKYTNPVHEELDDSLKELADKRIADLVAQGIPDKDAKEQGKIMVAKLPHIIEHYGYLRGEDFLEKKFSYYYKLGKKHMADRPGDPRPYFNTAVHKFHCGDYEEALLLYKRTLELDPANHMALNDIAVMYGLVVGDISTALQYTKKALEAMNESTNPVHRERVQKNIQEFKLKLLSKMLKI